MSMEDNLPEMEDVLNSWKSAKHALLTQMKVEQIRLNSFDATLTNGCFVLFIYLIE
jgi:hypothetical protein